MRIERGRYPVKAQGLEFRLLDDLELQQQRRCFLLQGENGIGKTTFLEKVLLPALDAGAVNYLYLGQDLRLQLFTLKALMAVKGVRRADADLPDLIRFWIRHSPSAGVLVMDEFDKYFKDCRFVFRWCSPDVHTFFIVSHRPLSRMVTPENDLDVSVLSFEKGDPTTALARVQVRCI